MLQYIINMICFLNIMYSRMMYIKANVLKLKFGLK